MRKPRYLYHQSRRSRRRSIERSGLDPARGLRRNQGCGDRLVYMTNCLEDCNGFGDIWRIDTRGVPVFQHFGEDTWWLSDQVIPAEKLKLIQEGF